MPIPIIPPIPPHLLLPGPATIAAVRAAAAAAAASPASAAGASSLLASALAHNLWNKNAPEWIREDESWKAFHRNKGDGNDDGVFVDEMAGLTAVIQKLEALVVTGYDKLGSERRMSRRRHVVRRCTAARHMNMGATDSQHSISTHQEGEGDDDIKKNFGVQRSRSQNSTMVEDDDDNATAPISTLEWHAALLAYWQLCNQIRERHPKWRDDIYVIKNRGKAGEESNLQQSESSDEVVTQVVEESGFDEGATLHYLQSAQVVESNNQSNAHQVMGKGSIVGIKNQLEKSEKEVLNFNMQSLQQKPEDETNTSPPQNNIESPESPSTCADDDFEFIEVPQSAKIEPPSTSYYTNNGDPETSASTTKSTQHQQSIIISPSETKELQIMFDYAVWAYEPEEKLLRSLLLTGKKPVTLSKPGGKSMEGSESDNKNHDDNNTTNNDDYGYQLIVHRTTSYIDPNEEILPNTSNDDDNPKHKKKPSKQKKTLRKPPGRVGYFVAISHKKRSLLIGMKGTSTLEELLTDCCGRAVRLDLDNDPHSCSPVDNDAVEDQDVETDEIGLLNSRRSVLIPVLIPYEQEEECNADISEEKKEAHEQEEECNDDISEEKKEDLLLSTASSSADALQINDDAGSADNDDCLLMDMVHLATSNDLCASESVEVELIHGDSQMLDIVNSASSLAQSLSREYVQEQPVPSSSSQTKAWLRKVPSDNVLLLSSSSSPTKAGQQSSSLKKQQSNPMTTEQPGVDHSLTNDFVESNGIEMESNRSHKLRGVHEGVLHCAQQLLFEISPLVEEYAVSKGYDVVCTGHSLGAGTAILLAVLIRGRYPALTVPKNNNECSDSDSGNRSTSRGNTTTTTTTSRSTTIKQQRQRVRAIAFAPPPVLDRASSLACRHYVTSIVNNSDIIPRSSLTNLDVFLTVLEAVRCRLVEVGMNPAGSNNNTYYSSKVNDNTSQNKPKRKSAIASTIALFCKLSEGSAGDLLLNPLELQRLWEEAVAEASRGDGEEDRFYWDEEFGHHLFVPGKLLMMHESWSSSRSHEKENENENERGDAVRPLQRELPTAAVEGNQNKNGSHAGEEGGINNNSQPGKRDTLPAAAAAAAEFHAMWTDGTDSVLKGFEVGAGRDMFTDHLTTSYQRALTLLMEQQSAF